MPAYSKKFKEQMLRRMLGPNPITATDLAEETGISQSTLSAWLREARTLGGTRADAPDAPTRSASSASAVPTTTPPTRLHTRTPQDQLRILVLADTLSGEELGAMLRREGLHAAELEAWRTTVFSALLGRAPTPAPTTRSSTTKSSTKTPAPKTPAPRGEGTRPGTTHSGPTRPGVSRAAPPEQPGLSQGKRLAIIVVLGVAAMTFLLGGALLLVLAYTLGR